MSASRHSSAIDHPSQSTLKSSWEKLLRPTLFGCVALTVRPYGPSTRPRDFRLKRRHHLGGLLWGRSHARRGGRAQGREAQQAPPGSTGRWVAWLVFQSLFELLVFDYSTEAQREPLDVDGVIWSIIVDGPDSRELVNKCRWGREWMLSAVNFRGTRAPCG